MTQPENTYPEPHEAGKGETAMNPETTPTPDPAIEHAAHADNVIVFPTAATTSGESTNPDTHLDIELDPEPDTLSALVPVDQPEHAHGARRRAIVPDWLRSRAALVDSLKWVGGVSAYHAAFHVLRLPLYAGRVLGWSARGMVVGARRLSAWVWVTDAAGLRKQALAEGDRHGWSSLRGEVGELRQRRAVVVAGCAVGAAGLGAGLWWWAPWWVQTPVMTVAVVVLAVIGKPVDRRFATSAVVTPRWRRVNADIVLRAYHAAGLGHPSKPNQQVAFASTMSRDSRGTGSEVLIDLPYGKGFSDAVRAREAIASGLDVSVNQVFLAADDSSVRRHKLFVADRDPLAIPAGRTDLLDLKPRDIWAPVRLGLDERGARVEFCLMWLAVLVGAQPRKGKTFAARLLALHAALDPYVRLFVVDGKNSPDWRRFSLIAHRIIFGTHPNAAGDPVEQLVEALRELKAHIIGVNEFLSTLPVTECPDGKLTRELSRKYEQLRVTVLVMEEFQTYFETEDQDRNKEIAELLSFILAVGPSAGVILLSASQKPSGVGAGDVARLFNRFRDNHTARLALKCGNRQVSEAVLGTDAYAEGYDASSLPVGDKYRGVGILYNVTDHAPTVRIYLADAEDAEKILIAARKHRERLGTLTGHAAGEIIERESRDVLADARSVIRVGESGLPWQEIAARLAEVLPEHYADTTAEAVSAQLRAKHVPSVNIKYKGQTLKGARTVDIDTAIKRPESR